jgi:hypothetical protein
LFGFGLVEDFSIDAEILVASISFGSPLNSEIGSLGRETDVEDSLRFELLKKLWSKVELMVL